MRRLTGPVQPYAWGSPTRIPQLLGRQADGTPQAELWLGAHPSGPGLLTDGDAAGKPLRDLIEADPAEVVGPASVERFGSRLPYLLKVLAADQPLSLQAHPTRRQAEDGYARERRAGVAADAKDRVYADDWPKPELFCALDESEALCGFREPARTFALFDQLGVPAARALVEPLRSGRDAALREVFGRLLTLPAADRRVVAEVVSAASSVARGEGDLDGFARTAVELDRCYPSDPGVLAALMMNRITLTAGQALFLPAGNLHAYLRGFGVELMANSDNVLRGGLTAKFVATDELLEILDFTSGPVPLVESVEQSPGVRYYDTPAPEFRLWRIESDPAAREVPATAYGRIVLAVTGRAVVRGAEDEIELAQGQSLFATAGEELTLTGDGTVFVAAPGLD